MSTNNLKPCQLCDFIAPSLKYLLKHLRQVHSHQPGFRITCRLSGCQRVFRTFDVYRNHVYAIHKEQESIVPEVSGPPADDPDDQEYLDDHNAGHTDFDDSSNVPELSMDDLAHLKVSSVKAPLSTCFHYTKDALSCAHAKINC